MGTFGDSWDLMKQCFKVLRSDPEIMIFPIISGFLTILALATFVFGFASVFLLQTFFSNYADALGLLIYPIMFVYYLVTYFIFTFFNVAVIGCADIRLKGGDPTLGDGFRIAFKHIGKIFVWALIAATVGIILQWLRSGKGVAGMIGRIVASLLGAAWSILTYFVVPVMIFENVGPITSIKRSALIIKEKWGTMLVSNFGLGLAMLVLAIPCIILFIGGFILLAFGISGGSAILIAVAIGLLALAFLWLMVVMVVNSAAKGVMVAVLYNFATNKEMKTDINPALLARMFTPGQQS